jgi:hypothetical protein
MGLAETGSLSTGGVVGAHRGETVADTCAHDDRLRPPASRVRRLGVRSSSATESWHRRSSPKRPCVARADRAEELAEMGTDRARGTPRERRRTHIRRCDRVGADPRRPMASLPSRPLARRWLVEIVVVAGRRCACNGALGACKRSVSVSSRDERALAGSRVSRRGRASAHKNPTQSRGQCMWPGAWWCLTR